MLFPQSLCWTKLERERLTVPPGNITLFEVLSPYVYWK